MPRLREVRGLGSLEPVLALVTDYAANALEDTERFAAFGVFENGLVA